jgi:hypothetical protein
MTSRQRIDGGVLGERGARRLNRFQNVPRRSGSFQVPSGGQPRN